MRSDGALSLGSELLFQFHNTFIQAALLLDQLEINCGTHDVLANAFFNQQQVLTRFG